MNAATSHHEVRMAIRVALWVDRAGKGGSLSTGAPVGAAGGSVVSGVPFAFDYPVRVMK
jgi:hypothetical protein